MYERKGAAAPAAPLSPPTAKERVKFPMFQGFSDAATDFLWGIRFNNERPWFEAHKAEYLQYVYEPMKALSGEVYGAMDRAYPELGLMCKVSRIYRDARRLYGRGPYKDHLWWSIRQPAEEWSTCPMSWSETAPEGCSSGLGYYAARPLSMAKFRARLDRDPKPFEKLVRAFNRQGRFALESDTYKRPKGDPGPLLSPWYNSRHISLICQREPDALLASPTLVQELLDGFNELMPFYRYFSTLDGDPDPRT